MWILTIRIANYCSTFLRGVGTSFVIQDCIKIQPHLLLGNFGQIQLVHIHLYCPIWLNSPRSHSSAINTIHKVVKGCSTINSLSIVFGTCPFAARRDPESSNSNAFQGGNVACETSVVLSVGSNVPFECLEHGPILRGWNINRQLRTY
jgi:hypothetical protein